MQHSVQTLKKTQLSHSVCKEWSCLFSFFQQVFSRSHLPLLSTLSFWRSLKCSAGKFGSTWKLFYSSGRKDTHTQIYINIYTHRCISKNLNIVKKFSVFFFLLISKGETFIYSRLFTCKVKYFKSLFLMIRAYSSWKSKIQYQNIRIFTFEFH